jgi:membrane-bound inhibitor of C-type lysozyme
MNTIKKLMRDEPLIAIGGGVVLILAAVLAGIVLTNQPEPVDSRMVVDESGQLIERAPLPESGEKLEYQFTCADGKTFITSYDLGSNALTLILSPEVSHVLPQEVTPVGARFSAIDGQVVFFEETGKARVELNGTVAYEDCVGE